MKRAILAIIGTVSGLVLLLGFKSHPATGTGGGMGVDTGARADAGAGVAAPAPSASDDSGSTTGPKSGKKTKSGKTAKTATTRTVTGDAVDTRYGPVQVQITLTGSRITRVRVIQVPTESPRDQEIASFSVPQLDQEALSAQSARIDTVSGATYTSEGYIQSLQSAIDKAGR